MKVLSPYILSILVGWVVAQRLKYVIVAVKTADVRNLRPLYLSGNMPSAHTATVVALVTVIALKDGLDSGLFGLAALFAGIVMYDAIMVRRSVGEQGKAIQKLINEQKSKVAIPRAAKGHTPIEVAVGAGLGLLIGYVVFITTI